MRRPPAQPVKKLTVPSLRAATGWAARMWRRGLATSCEYLVRCERYHGRRPKQTALNPTRFLPRSQFFLVCLLL